MAEVRREKLREVRPARKYKPVDDLWVVAAYFNFNGYRSKLANLEVFAESLNRSGLNYLIVECAKRGERFSLSVSPHILRVQCDSVLWQKERLLNIAISKLPRSCRKVAWLDADVLFSNGDWAVKTSESLDNHPIAQPFQRVIRLPPGTRSFAGAGNIFKGFAYVHSRKPGMFLTGKFNAHGHTGFAWAARRELLERHRLYELSISGGGDHLMAHAFCGDLGSPCVKAMVGSGTPYSESYERWATEVYGETLGNIGWVQGTALHLWHGEIENRRYSLRTKELLSLGYNPARDLRTNRGGTLRWGDRSSRFRVWAEDYFAHRKEDTGASDALLAGQF